jgi:hypothetical protein
MSDISNELRKHNVRKHVESLLWALHLELNQAGVPEEKQHQLVRFVFAEMRRNRDFSDEKFSEICRNVMNSDI